MAFKQAVKVNARARVALVGVPGGGKSYTMLKLARLLAGPDGKIACIDTEHGSLSKYAPPPGVAADNKNYFDFDVDEGSSFTFAYFMEQLTYAEEKGYAVFCCDSFAHFWIGDGGALDFVDKVNQQEKFQMAGWKKWRPHEREMVQRMIASPCHVIVTIRTKNDVVITEVNGKQVPKKVGLKPQQTEGIEYEFDFVGTLDSDNTLVVDKSRCPWYRESEANGACNRPGYAYFRPFVEWLGGGAQEINPRREATAPPQFVPAAPECAGSANGTSGGAPVCGAENSSGIPEVDALWKTMGTRREAIKGVLAVLHSDLVELLGFDAGDAEYADILRQFAAGDPVARVSFARRTVLELWKKIQEAKQPKDPEPGQGQLIEMPKEPVYAD